MSSLQHAMVGSPGVSGASAYRFPGAPVWIALIILTMPIREVSLLELGASHGRIGDVVLALGFSLWLAAGCIKGRVAFTTNALDRVVLLFLIVYTLSLFWAENFGRGLNQLLKLLRNGMLYILLVDYLSVNFPPRYRLVAGCFLVTGLMQAAAFMWSMAQYGGVAALAILLQAEAVQSNNPILNVVRTAQGGGIFLRGAASWFPLCIFIGLSIVPFIRRRVGRGSVWFLIVLMGGLTVLSATRSAWIGMAAGFIAMAVVMARGITLRKIMIGMGPIVIVLVAAMSFNLHTFIQSRFTSDVLKNDPAIQERLDFFLIALDAFRESPILGKGVANIASDELFIVHNVYLQVLGELGVIGGTILACLIGLWIAALFSARRVAISRGDGFGARVSAAILGASVFFLTYFLAGHDLAGGEPWVVMAIASALFTYERGLSRLSPRYAAPTANLQRTPPFRR